MVMIKKIITAENQHGDRGYDNNEDGFIYWFKHHIHDKVLRLLLLLLMMVFVHDGCGSDKAIGLLNEMFWLLYQISNEQ